MNCVREIQMAHFPAMHTLVFKVSISEAKEKRFFRAAGGAVGSRVDRYVVRPPRYTAAPAGTMLTRFRRHHRVCSLPYVDQHLTSSKHQAEIKSRFFCNIFLLLDTGFHYKLGRYKNGVLCHSNNSYFMQTRTSHVFQSLLTLAERITKFAYAQK